LLRKHYKQTLLNRIMLMEWIDNGRVFDIVIALFVWYFYYKFKKQPSNHTMQSEVKKMQVDLDTSFMELWDYVENSIKPIRSRIESRLRRGESADKKEQEDLSMSETNKKKGGILTPAEAKKYGIH